MSYMTFYIGALRFQCSRVDTSKKINALPNLRAASIPRTHTLGKMTRTAQCNNRVVRN